MLKVEVVKTITSSTRNRRSYDEIIGDEKVVRAQYIFRDQPFDIFSLPKDIPGNCLCTWVYSYIRNLMTLKYICTTCPAMARHGQ
jgi:hypothetical protein